MSRTFRSAIPAAVAAGYYGHDGTDVHYNVGGTRTDRFAGSELNLNKECKGARLAHNRTHRRRANRATRRMVADVERFDADTAATYDARRTSGWLTH